MFWNPSKLTNTKIRLDEFTRSIWEHSTCVENLIIWSWRYVLVNLFDVSIYYAIKVRPPDSIWLFWNNKARIFYWPLLFCWLETKRVTFRTFLDICKVK